MGMPPAGFLQNDALMHNIFSRALQGGLGADLTTGFTAPGPISLLGQNTAVQLAAGGHIGAFLSMPGWDLNGQAVPLPGQLGINIGGRLFQTSQSNVWDPNQLGIANQWLGGPAIGPLAGGVPMAGGGVGPLGTSVPLLGAPSQFFGGTPPLIA